MYFAHHQGLNIRLAYADKLTGPWTLHPGGTLQLEEAKCAWHVASPDVHVDHGRQRIVMYYHGGLEEPKGQWSFRTESADGVHFVSDDKILGAFYLRVFKYGGAYYGLAKDNKAPGGGLLLRSPDGIEPFEVGTNLIHNMRHAAVRVRGDILDIFYSRGEDCPERILYSSMPLVGDWRTWTPTKPVTVLEPELDYEGGNEPLVASSFGAIHQPVRQLRDPALFEEAGKLYLFYSNAGESGISGAEVIDL
jgi:hypothetical protein